MLLALGLSLTQSSSASAAVTNSTDPTQIAGAIGAPGVVTGGASIQPTPYYDPPSPSGIGDTPLAGFPTEGGTFGVLTSGDAALADDPNDDSGSGFAHGSEQLPAKGNANDPTILQVDINVPADHTCVAFDFRFLSDEFPEFIDSGFNDAFVAEIDSSTWTVDETLPDGSVVAPDDFAGGAGDLISVDSTGPSGQSEAEAAGTTYDGATGKLIARSPISPGAHTIYFSIFDVGDSILDSAVFVDNLRTTTETGAKCKSLSVDPFEGTTGVTTDPNDPNPVKLCAGFSCAQFNLTCNLPDGGPVPCSPFIAVQVNFATGQVGRESARRATPMTFAQGAVSIPPGATQSVEVPATPEGTAAMKAQAKKSAKLAKKAKKLKKKAKSASGSKAKKLRKKAKKAKKKSKALKTLTGQVNISTASNGATSTVPFSVTLP